MAVTSIPIRPSSTSTVLPTDRSVVKPSYVTATISLLPITDLSVVKVKANAFDGRGNYAMGVKEQLIFPEIEYDKIDKVRGMDIIFVTTAKTDEEARELLTLLGAPFAR